MKTHTAVRVGNTHFGQLTPGMIIIVPNEDANGFAWCTDEGSHVWFTNPAGGSSWGTVVDVEKL